MKDKYQDIYEKLEVTEEAKITKTFYNTWNIRYFDELSKHRDEFKQILKSSRGGKYVGYKYDIGRNSLMIIGTKIAIYVKYKSNKVVPFDFDNIEY